MIFIFEKWFNRKLFCLLSFYRLISFLLSVFLIVLEAFQKLQTKTQLFNLSQLGDNCFTSCNGSRGLECVHLKAFMRSHGWLLEEINHSAVDLIT